MEVKVQKKSLIKNAVFSALKTLTTILFPLITYPYITRVLSVENIGKINFGQSVVSYFVLLAAFGISTYAVRNGSQIRDDKTSFSVFANEIFTINILTTVVSFCLLLIVLCLPTKIADYRTIILILSVSVLLTPIAVEWIYIINEDFGYITLRSFIIHLLSLVLMFAFVKKEEDVLLYAALTTMSTSLGNIFNFLHSRKYVRLRVTARPNWKVHKKSIQVFFINSIASTIYLNSDTTLLGIMKDDYAVGLYGVATKIYLILKQLFNAIIASTIPRLAYLKKTNESEFKDLIRNIISLVLFFTLPATVGIIILRKEIILLISGEAYLGATSTLAVLALAIFFAVMSNVFANGLLICLGREKKVVNATLVSAVSNIVLNLLFIPLLSQVGAAVTTLIAEITVFCMCLYFARDYVLQLFDRKAIFDALLGSAVLLVAGLCVYPQVERFGLLLRITIMIFIEVFLYASCMLLLRDKTIMMLFKLFKRKV